jgi:hypothetical protein
MIIVVVHLLLMNIDHVNQLDAVLGPLLTVLGAVVALIVELGLSGEIIMFALVGMNRYAQLLPR